MLTGQPPFPGDDAVSIISQHLHADPVPPSRHNPDVPEALDRVVLGAARQAPEDRPANAAAARQLILDAMEEKEDEEAGPDNPLESLAGGVFVGRELELDRMREAVDARARRPGVAAAAGRGAGHRQDPGRRGARHLRTRQRRTGLLGPLPRGRGGARLLALGAGDPLLRPRRRPGRAGLADRRRRGRGRAADPGGGGEARHRARRRIGQRGGALPPLRLGHQPAARGGARPAAGDRPRRPPLGRRAVAAPAPLRGEGARLERPADRRHLPRRRARPPPSARPGARRDLGHRGQRAHPAARSRGGRGRALHRDDLGRPLAPGPRRGGAGADGRQPVLRRRGGPAARQRGQADRRGQHRRDWRSRRASGRWSAAASTGSASRPTTRSGSPR